MRNPSNKDLGAERAVTRAGMQSQRPSRGVPCGGVRRSKRAAVVTLLAGPLFAIIAGGAGANVLDNLKTGGFDNPNSDSVLAGEALAAHFPGSAPKLVLLVDTSDGLESTAGKQALEGISAAVATVHGASITASYGTTKQLARGTNRGVVLVAI